MSYVLPTEAGGRRFHRTLWWGLAASVVIHAGLFLIWRADSPAARARVAAGPRAGDPIAAPAGGGALQAVAVEIAAPQAIEVPAPPEYVPDLAEPEMQVLTPRDDASRVRVTLAAPGDASGRHAPGLQGFTGAGDGGSDAAGPYRSTMAVPRTIIPEWDPPDEVRGMHVDVRVLVSERGQALEVQLRPPTPVSDFNERLIDLARRMEFVPARRNGQVVRDWTTFTMSF